MRLIFRLLNLQDTVKWDFWTNSRADLEEALNVVAHFLIVALVGVFACKAIEKQGHAWQSVHTVDHVVQVQLLTFAESLRRTSLKVILPRGT